MDRPAFKIEMVFVCLPEKLKKFIHEDRDFTFQSADSLMNLFVSDYLMGYIQSEHGKWYTAFENDLCRFCIHVYIEFRSRCPVAECAAAHKYYLFYVVFNFRGLEQCKCDIRQRTGWNECDFLF